MMSKKYRVILFVLLVVGGIFNFGQTVQAENVIEWPVAVDETNFPDEEFRNYLKEEFGIDKELSEAEMQSVGKIDVYKNNSITSLKGIEYFQNLEYLSCAYVGISELNVSKNTKLKYLYCFNTVISSLDVSKNIKLEYLYCYYTGISELDISKNTNLDHLYCYHTGISELDVSKNIKLEYLYCNNTGISSLDVSKNTNLKDLSCFSTGISELDVSNNPNLVWLECYYTGISELDVSNNPYLYNLSCNSTEISELDVGNNPKLKYLYCSRTKLSSLDVSKNPKLEYLYCSRTKLSSLDVSKNINLAQLYCSDTKISELDVGKNTKLVELDCSDTEISELDVSKNTNLERLDCSDTEISELDVSNTSLKKLYGAGCVTPVLLSSGNIINLSQLTGLDISKMSNLQNATLSEGKLKVEDPSKMVSYTYDCGKSISITFTLEISSYEIKYNANGGTGQMLGVLAKKGNLFNLPKNEFTAPNGKQFKEWAIGSIRGEKVKAGEPYTFSEAVTVYAVWENKPIVFDETNFPDDEFRNYLLGQNFGADDGKISEEEMKNVTAIDVSGNKNITSLKGIEYFQNLQQLDCSFTGISSLDVSNTSLTDLSCAGCVTPVLLSSGNIINLSQLTGLDISKVSNLQNATLSEGKLTVKDPSEIVSYTYDCGKEYRITFTLEISSYEIKYNANGGTGQMLGVLAKKGNLFNLPKNEFTAPNGRQFKEWAIGSIRGEKVKAGEPYTFSEAVTVYAVWENKPIVFDETNFPDDEFRNYLLGQNFGADDGKISEEEMKNVTAIDVSGNKNITSLKGIEYFQNLQQLDCSFTGISSLDVSNTSLTDLSCAGCVTPVLLSSGNIIDLSQLTGLDISKMSNLQNATLSEGKLKVEDPSKMVSYTYDCGKSISITFKLEISSYEIKYDANGGTGQMAKALAEKGKAFTLPQSSFTAPSGKRLKEWSIGSTDGAKVKAGETYTFSKPVTVYAVWEKKPIVIDETNFPDEEFRNYLLGQNFGADDGKISEEEMKNLTAIDVSGNKNIASLKGIEYFQNLQQLDCSFTGISSLDVSNTSLTDLSCAGCVTPVLLTNGNIIDLSQLTGLDISKMSNIQNATLSEGKLKVEDPSKMVSYTYDCGKSISITFKLEISSYEIKYDANGGTGQIPGITAEKGESVTLPENEFTAPDGMQFKEWAIGSTSGDKIKAGEPYTFSEAVTVYAVWEPIPVSVITTYAVTFNANGGTGQMPKATATKGKAFTLPQSSFTAPSGKRFKEWAVGSVGGVKVKAGGTYTFTGAATVYAVWETIPSTVKDVKKATFKELQLKAKASKTSNKLTWKKVKGADGYIVYGAKRGKKLTEIKASTKGVSFTHKKLSKKTFYQYQVKAYRLINGEKKIISVSQNIYSVTTGGKYDNAKKLTVNMSKLTLKKGRTKTIKAKLVAANGKKMKNYTYAFRYETSNSKIAVVSAKGRIKARKKGKCTIYVYTQNGLSKSIRVTVK